KPHCTTSVPSPSSPPAPFPGKPRSDPVKSSSRSLPPQIALAQLSIGARAERMASRYLLRLRAGASAAAQSARGHHFPAGRTAAPAMGPTTGSVADAGRFFGGIPALQGARHYGTPSNHSVVEVNRATGKVQGRLDVLEKKGDTRHKGSVQKGLKKHGKGGSSGIKYDFDRFANVVMVVGYGFTFSVVMYYHFPWSWL
ncbi:unnamed protein product, partial [Urochloa humidicola]